MSDDGTPALYGYASSFSAAPGETMTFHVSGENVRDYQAQLVKLRHGYDGPGSPGFLEQERPCDADGQYAASLFRCAVGSYVEVDDADQQLRPDAELRFGVLFYATTPELACQGLLGAWSQAENAGYALLIEQGCLVFRLGDGEQGAELRLSQQIRSHTWYAASAGWNGAAGSAIVNLEPSGARTDRAMDEAAAEFEQVVRLQPDYVEGHLNLGIALARRGSLSAALDQFQTALRLEPGNGRAREFITRIEQLSARGSAP